MPNQFTDEDYPGLYQAANKSSMEAQLKYVILIAIDLILMILAAGLAIYNYQQPEARFWVYSISGLFLLVGLIITIVIRTKKYEDIWYQGRALAESCKTLTWRYMTMSESFESDLEDEEAKQIFIDRLNELSNEFKELNKVLNAKTLNLPFITEKMKNVRDLNLLERKQFYIENRIEDQKEWYSTKAESNKKRYAFWFWLIIISQALAIVSIVYLIKFPNSNWNLVGLFTTLSSSVVSWIQIKQHQELKQAYTTAAQELNFIHASSGPITEDNELSEFVLDSENAISREHTLWLAQKRK